MDIYNVNQYSENDEVCSNLQGVCETNCFCVDSDSRDTNCPLDMLSECIRADGTCQCELSNPLSYNPDLDRVVANELSSHNGKTIRETIHDMIEDGYTGYVDWFNNGLHGISGLYYSDISDYYEFASSSGTSR